MIYVFDTCSIRGFQHFYPANFKSVWDNIDTLIKSGYFISVREVYEELAIQGIPDFLKKWSITYKHIFEIPNRDEAEFINQMFAKNHNTKLISPKYLQLGSPVADPFVIAKAYVISGTVITEEKRRDNSSKIPNICDQYDIPCMNLEEFMIQEKWAF
jgi:hypothetical protein